MEPNPKRIEDLRRLYGYDEEEAVIAYHLRQANIRLFAMYRAEAEAEAGTGRYPEIQAEMFLQSSVIPHFRALDYLLAKRVLARHYPGWVSRGSPAPEEEPPE